MIVAALIVASLIAPEAQLILDQGHWGLITGDLSAESISQAKTCEGPWISFAFSETEVQVIPHEGKSAPSSPPEIYRAVRVVETPPHTRFELFYVSSDRAAARRYLYDPSVKSLMRLMPDGDGDALYVLCD